MGELTYPRPSIKFAVLSKEIQDILKQLDL